MLLVVAWSSIFKNIILLDVLLLDVLLLDVLLLAVLLLDVLLLDVLLLLVSLLPNSTFKTANFVVLGPAEDKIEMMTPVNPEHWPPQIMGAVDDKVSVVKDPWICV